MIQRYIKKHYALCYKMQRSVNGVVLALNCAIISTNINVLHMCVYVNQLHAESNVRECQA